MPAFEADYSVAELEDCSHVVADEKNSPAFFVAYLVHFAHTFFLELHITDSEHLVDNEYLRAEVCSDCEGEADVHSAGEAFYRCIKEFFHARELYDVVEILADFPDVHTQNCGVEVDVFAACEVGVEACSDFEEAGDPALDADSALCRSCNPAEEF